METGTLIILGFLLFMVAYFWYISYKIKQEVKKSVRWIDYEKAKPVQRKGETNALFLICMDSGYKKLENYNFESEEFSTNDYRVKYFAYVNEPTAFL